MALFNVFSDPKLAARQAQLDSQWRSLNALVNTCNNVPSSSWVEFVADFKSWTEFFQSGSDWSASSKAATDEWQSKAQTWVDRISSYGCAGTLGSVDGINVVSAVGDAGVPTIKDPPPNDPTFLDEVTATVGKVTEPIWSRIGTVGWVAAGLIVLIILGLVWVLTKGKASGYGVKLGET